MTRESTGEIRPVDIASAMDNITVGLEQLLLLQKLILQYICPTVTANGNRPYIMRTE